MSLSLRSVVLLIIVSVNTPGTQRADRLLLRVRSTIYESARVMMEDESAFYRARSSSVGPSYMACGIGRYRQWCRCRNKRHYPIWENWGKTRSNSISAPGDRGFVAA